ncbi:MAG: HNH endonuclease [Deltaproteobacteria bacterium]|nr:HNH endonuclease [Deltaproteobacteria bacterium]
MADPRTIPKRLEKTLFQEAGSRCPNCSENDVSTLTIHHIKPFSENPVHNRADMIVLCANCHARADRGEITTDRLYDLKALLGNATFHSPQTPSSCSQTVIGQSNFVAGGDIQVGHLHISTPRTKGKGRVGVIPGTVATDPHKVGYLKHLAKRYNEFKEYEAGKDNMRYALVYQAYQREIKYGIEHTPLELFEMACKYLQTRIENTMLGRIRKKQEQKLYSTFEEFFRTGDESPP